MAGIAIGHLTSVGTTSGPWVLASLALVYIRSQFNFCR